MSRALVAAASSIRVPAGRQIDVEDDQLDAVGVGLLIAGDLSSRSSWVGAVRVPCCRREMLSACRRARTSSDGSEYGHLVW